MKSENVVAFLPCRKGSERIIGKNTRPFTSADLNLTQLKLKQLLTCPQISKIIVSSDDPEVLDIARSMNSSSKPVNAITRSAHLSSSDVATDALVRHVPEIIEEPDSHILWTHVTSPFSGEAAYSRAIHKYFENLGNFDSLMSVTRLGKFIWDETGPANYDGNRWRWPRTQDLNPLYEINSAIFIAPRDVYLKCGDRVGQAPFLFQSEGYEGFDIDWPDDFKLAELMWTNRDQLGIRA